MYQLKRILAAAAMLAATAVSAQNLVQNGSFEQILKNGELQTQLDNYSIVSDGTVGRIDYNLAGWTNQGKLAIAYGSGISDSVYPLTSGTLRQNMALIGPNSPTKATANGLTASSPDGGYFFGSDANPSTNSGALTQTINGLEVGKSYKLSFSWAAGQATAASSTGQDLNVGWDVSLGSDVNASVQTTIAYKGFSGWTQASYTFTASSASELLSFFPTSSAGSPPMALLDGVSIVAVPEPGTWAMMIFGLGIVGVLGRRRLTRR